MHPRHLLLDLDGTLTDPREGIFACIRHAFAALALPPPPEEALPGCVGPPLREVFAGLLGPKRGHLVEPAVAHYRERYGAQGLYECRVYAGIPACLEALGQDATLHVATAKAVVYAHVVLRHFGLAGYFRAVYGPELDGTRSDKAELIAHLLAEEGVAPGDAAMIGDRGNDIRAARANGMAGYGVAWGFGSHEELHGAGAAAIFERPAEMAPYFVASGR